MRKWTLSLAAAALMTNSGCTLQEALIDGFYGGISDIVAAVIQGLALGAN